MPRILPFFARYPDQRSACYVAYRRDLLERRGLLEAFRRGDEWALKDVADSLEFYEELFGLPEYNAPTS